MVNASEHGTRCERERPTFEMSMPSLRASALTGSGSPSKMILAKPRSVSSSAAASTRASVASGSTMRWGCRHSQGCLHTRDLAVALIGPWKMHLQPALSLHVTHSAPQPCPATEPRYTMRVEQWRVIKLAHALAMAHACAHSEHKLCRSPPTISASLHHCF